MGQKVHPVGFRIGILRSWSSKWFATKYTDKLREDVLLREWLRKKLRKNFVNDITLERSGNTQKIIIATSRPGMLIGRGGAGIEELRRAAIKKLSEVRGTKINPQEVRLEVLEVRNPDSHAALVAQSVAEQIERRLPFRRVLKRSLERIMSSPGVGGAKIEIAGRLGGAEMSRREWAAEGKVPLHTLRADIDFAQETAYTTWGTIGVKVWLYKGEVFKEKEQELGT